MTGSFLDADGARLRYEVVGDGIPVMVLHGGPGPGHDYLRDDLAGLLSGHCRLVFHDPRGCGGSLETPAPFVASVLEFLREVSEVDLDARRREGEA